MAVAREPERLPFPLFVNTSHRMNVAMFSDGAEKTVAGTTMTDVTMVFRNAAATFTKTYTCTATSNTLGTGFIQLAGASHSSTGDWNIQARLGGITKKEYVVEFKTKY